MTNLNAKMCSVPTRPHDVHEHHVLVNNAANCLNTHRLKYYENR